MTTHHTVPTVSEALRSAAVFTIDDLLHYLGARGWAVEAVMESADDERAVIGQFDYDKPAFVLYKKDDEWWKREFESGTTDRVTPTKKVHVARLRTRGSWLVSLNEMHFPNACIRFRLWFIPCFFYAAVMWRGNPRRVILGK